MLDALFVLFDSVKKNPLISLGISTMVAFLVWMYKDSRSNSREAALQKMGELEKRLLLFSQLESYLAYYRRENTVNDKLELYKKLAECNVYFEDHLRKVTLGFYEDHDMSRLHSIRSLIKEQIEELKEERLFNLSKIRIENKLDYVFTLFDPLKSIGLFILVALFITSVSMTAVLDINPLIKVMVFFTFLSFIPSLFSAYALILKRGIFKRRGLVLLVLIFFLPTIPFITFIFIVQSNLVYTITVVLVLISQGLLSSIVSRYSNKRISIYIPNTNKRR